MLSKFLSVPNAGGAPLTHRAAILACLASALLSPTSLALAGALEDYVAAPDKSFLWKEIDSAAHKTDTAFRLECISQTWRGNAWQHQILVVRPREIRNPDIIYLYITGDEDVIVHLPTLTTVSTAGGALAAVINRVPNQPLYDGRKEDALIAYTLNEYMKSGDKTWPLLFPMVKAAVRGMDSVEAFAKKQFGNKIERFVIGGASKRGWTTWLTGAVDTRVSAITPMVIDTLNMKVQTQWAQKMYGRQSEQIEDYVALHLTELKDEPRAMELRSWIDPYSYRARYKMPKLLLLGTNDPYWVVDSLRHYWNELPEPKLVFQTPNAGHDLGGGREAIPTLAAFFQMIADHQPLPQMTWSFNTNSAQFAELDVTVNPPAKAFKLWTANSVDRDFRDDKWTSSDLPADPATHATAKVELPKSGYRAYLVEAQMTSPKGQNYKLSTEARVIPDGAPAKVTPATGTEPNR